jgi:cytolysin (calcineurin-like family phosphatase)
VTPRPLGTARIAAALLPLLAVSLNAGCGSEGETPRPPGDAGLTSATDATLPSGDSGLPGAGGSDGGAQEGGDGGGAQQGGGDGGGPADASPPPPAHFDITFYVMADSHADQTPDNPDNLYAQALAINNVATAGVAWPTSIDGGATSFLGGTIAPPLGVVICGDLTGWGIAPPPPEIPNFQTYFQQGTTSYSINYPAYVGLGNHDLDTTDGLTDAEADPIRATYWQYIASRYQGPQAPIPVTNFDPASEDYSWDWAGVHLIMTHRFAGDTEYGHPSGLPWLAADLQQYASDGRPVFIFHHYGMDEFGMNGEWWTPTDRLNYRTLLTGYHITADMVGHTHYAFSYMWDGLNVQQINNAKAEINTGNNDGNGSFAIVRVTDTHFDMVTCRWTDEQGDFELIEPFYSGPSDPGPAPPTTLLPEGAFASTCSNISLQGNNVLAATCSTASGTQSTTLDLDTCITNAGGTLWWDTTSGNYAASCTSCSLSTTQLTCQCNNGSGTYGSTSIELDNNITNCNGTLTYGPC